MCTWLIAWSVWGACARWVWWNLLSYSTWYRHYSVCPNRKLCPGCSCCEAFCMQCALVNSNKLLIQSSTGNSILRIYWWFQIWLRNLAQAATNIFLSLVQYQKWSLSVIPVSLYFGGSQEQFLRNRRPINFLNLHLKDFVAAAATA